MENTPSQDPTTQSSEPLRNAEISSTPQVQPVITQVPVHEPTVSLARKINHITALVLVFSGIIFVLVTILAIWQVFGPDASSVVWRSLGSLGAIALGALIVSVSSKLIEDSQQKK